MLPIAGRKTATGIPCDFDLIKSSANAFENVYVFGQSPNNLNKHECYHFFLFQIF